MLVSLLHFLGLTNLSEEQVLLYEAKKIGLQHISFEVTSQKIDSPIQAKDLQMGYLPEDRARRSIITSMARSPDTTIGRESRIENGTIYFSGHIHIDGNVSLNIFSDDPFSMVTIGAKALIAGDVSASNVVVDGVVKGNVNSSSTVLLNKTCDITGDVIYSLIEMVMGAQVSGSLIYDERGKEELVNVQSLSQHRVADQGT